MTTQSDLAQILQYLDTARIAPEGVAFSAEIVASILRREGTRKRRLDDLLHVLANLGDHLNNMVRDAEAAGTEVPRSRVVEAMNQLVAGLKTYREEISKL